MRVLVIGGAGYIGSHVTRALIDAGHETGVYDNFTTGLDENLFPESTVYRCDILDQGALEETMKNGYQAVVHLAALKAAGESMVKPEEYATNNITGTINILNAMARNKIHRMVFSSSAAVYGEPEYLPLDEDHPTRPENFYGFTKLEIERLMRWYLQLRGIGFASLRYFNAAGYDPDGRITGLERNPANLLPVIMEVATGVRSKLSIFGDDYPTPDGTCIRDYIHVTDLADAHVAALNHIDQHGGELVVNLGSESGLSVLEMLETARRVTGQEIPAELADRRPGDPAKLVASSQRARELLGFSPRHSDAETLVDTSYRAYCAASQ